MLFSLFGFFVLEAWETPVQIRALIIIIQSFNRWLNSQRYFYTQKENWQCLIWSYNISVAEEQTAII